MTVSLIATTTGQRSLMPWLAMQRLALPFKEIYMRLGASIPGLSSLSFAAPGQLPTLLHRDLAPYSDVGGRTPM